MVEIKKVVIVGPTGSGKSALCNILAGKKNLFKESEAINSQTYETCVKTIKWMGNGPDYKIIDTPGHGDSEGRDSTHIRQMVEVLKAEQNANAFIILLNGQAPRLDEPLKSMLTTLLKIFGGEFLKHSILAFSRWGFDTSSIRRRQQNGETEYHRAKSMAEHFRAAFQLDYDVPSFFYEKEYANRPDEVPDEEYELYVAQMEYLTEFVNNCESCDMRGLVAILAEKDRLKKEALEQKARADAEELERIKQEMIAAQQKQIADEQTQRADAQTQIAAKESERANLAMAAAKEAMLAAQTATAQAEAAVAAQHKAEKEAQEIRDTSIISMITENQQIPRGTEVRESRKTRWHGVGYRDTVWETTYQKIEHQQRTKTTRGNGSVEYTAWQTVYIESKEIGSQSYHE